MKSSHISRASYQERFPCSVLNSSLNTFKYPSKSCITPHHQPTTTRHPRTTTTTNGIQIQNSTLFPHPFPLHSHPPCRNSWNLHSSATPSWHNQHFLHLQAQMAPFIHPTNHFLWRGPFFAPSVLVPFGHGRFRSSANWVWAWVLKKLAWCYLN